jgi:WhiB family redox-sensing transcriptional regulator
MAVQPFRTAGMPDDRWWLRAACGPEQADLFFPEPGSLSRKEWRRRETAAKAVCATCSVQVPCLEEALLTPELFGVWGGMTAEERAQARSRAEQESDAVSGPGASSGTGGVATVLTLLPSGPSRVVETSGTPAEPSMEDVSP